MKSKVILLSILIYFISGKLVFADNVPVETAKKVAKTIYYEMVPSSLKLIPEDFIISEVFTTSQNETPLYYIFNIGNENGVVIISGQDNVTPVLGYSFKGRYQRNRTFTCLY